ncbi:MAG: methionine--tRNA ligase [Metamycoplasmataceae bacterium]
MNKQKTLYITTPIFYPSGNLHLGHFYSTTIAWSFKNFKKKLGYKVLFSTGSDEHGQKIEQKALSLNLSPQKYVDGIFFEFEDFWKKLEIEYDLFSRTTNPKHQKLIRQIFWKMMEKGYIYKGSYKGLYSVQDEEFILEKDAIKEGNNFLHPTSKHILQIVEEPSYFFKMSLFEKWLVEYNKENPDFIPNNKIWLEIKKNFIDNGLKDLSVTRCSFSWGIEIDPKEKDIIYVWLDALFSYISILDYDLEKNENNKYDTFWDKGTERVHIIGKEITRFHCIYWPIFLKSLDIKLPTKIITHGLINDEIGRKMSKSLGNVIDPLELCNQFSPEILKLYLMSSMNIFEDSNFDKKELLNLYNSFLVNNLGNLISRTTKMIKNSFSKPVQYNKTNLEEDDLVLQNKIIAFKQDFISKFDSFNIDKAFKEMINLCSSTNKYIDLTTPWLLTNKLERLETVLNMILNSVYAIITCLEIVMPKTVIKIKEILNIKKDLNFDDFDNFEKFNNIQVNDNVIIFPRRNE